MDGLIHGPLCHVVGGRVATKLVKDWYDSKMDFAVCKEIQQAHTWKSKWPNIGYLGSFQELC